MIRLLAAEMQRIAARRLVRLTVVLTFAGIVLGGLAAFVWSDSLSEAAYQQRVVEATARDEAQRAQIEDCIVAHGVAAAQRSRTTLRGSASRPRTSRMSTIPDSTATGSAACSRA